MRYLSARRVGATILALGAMFALGGCTKEPDEPEATAADRLEQAHQTLTDAGSVRLSLEGSELPEDQDTYVISAKGEGTMNPPAFKGLFTAQFRGVQADIPVVAVDDELFARLPFTKMYASIDPEAFNVPDPAQLLDKDTGLASFLTETSEPTFGERVRAGEDVVQEVTGTLPGETVRRVLGTGADSDFDVTYGLVEDAWEVRSVSIQGEFYPPTASVYELTFDGYGEPVTIERP